MDRYADGTHADIMKHPGAGGKSSLPGALAVTAVDGIPTVFPRETGEVSEADDLLRVVYDHGPVEVSL